MSDPGADDELADALAGLASASTIGKAATRRQRAIQWAQEARASVEGRRSTSRPIETVLRSFERDSEAGGSVLAGAVGFRIFLFQVPYMFCVVTIAGVFSSTTPGERVTTRGVTGIGSLTAEAVKSTTSLHGWSLFWVLLVAVSTTLLAARAAMKVLWTVHGLIWRVPRPRMASSGRATLSFVLVVTFAVGLSGLIGWVKAENLMVGLLVQVAGAAVMGVLWLVVTSRLPHHPDCGWRDFVPGAILVSVGILGLHALTIYWLADSITGKSQTYGTIGVALGLLLWAYLLGRVITSAAVLNRSLWEISQVSDEPMGATD